VSVSGGLSVVLAGGGSTGHVAPLLALADCLRRRDPTTGVTVLGTAEGVEARLVPDAGYPFAVVPRVPLPRRPSADLGRLPWRLRSAIAAAGRAMRESQAQAVVGFGGYVSTPAYLAARRLGLPIVVHEQNARPGLANRLGARFTPYVAVTFPGTPLRGARVLGMPLRRQITTLDRGSLRAQALVTFGLEPGRTTLLVFGGSLGAQRLNVTFGESREVLAEAGVQVLHVTGRGKTVDGLDEARARGSASPSAAAGSPAYVAVEYVDRMDLAYAAADTVVCRAGAGTVCELTTVGLPAAYVPLPIGNGEQRLNAEPVVEAGGGILVDDPLCTPQWVRETLVPLLLDASELAAMGKAAGAFGITDGDERLADLVDLTVAESAGAGKVRGTPP
jgi:UDP-N-acetylglucosamine--N-acetylmuramyl-(pentapeptide) pyrophosphoryl-undecaprenol N-acetylglucosamine transferase